MNHGLTATEIAETIKLPASLDGAWHGRGYYGHIRHNVKAIYQKYLGWYDANPVNLDPLPPVEAGRNMSNTWAAPTPSSTRARKDFAKGEFRFVAQALSHLVFADPDNAGGTRAARRYVRATRLPGGVRHMAQHLPVRRAGAAPRHGAAAARHRPVTGDIVGARHGASVGHAERAGGSGKGSRKTVRHQLDLHRYQ